jgi:hypothetical protein
MSFPVKLTAYFALVFTSLTVLANHSGAQQPIASTDLVFAEKDGVVSVEAEHFFQQTANEKRAFYLVTPDSTPDVRPDGDPAHLAGASGGAYIEILPDTRRTHADKLIKGTNFSPAAGEMVVVSYKVNIANTGRYYVWARAFSTGSEDNGLHVGIDGTWPDSGQRMQWCQGKKTWRWESKQRTEEQHCGEAFKIFLDIDTPGEHLIHFSMREDGFEFDKWLMTNDRDFVRPDGVGPKPLVASGTPPNAYPTTAAVPADYWGPQQKKDDSKPTAKKPATKNASQQVAKQTGSLRLPAKSFSFDGTGYYLDQEKWAAINPDKNKTATVQKTIEFPTGKYNVTLQAVGESDGQSTYTVGLDDEMLGNFTCPLSTQMFEEGKKFHKTWPAVTITDGTVIKIQSTIASKDGDEYSRARWAAVTFTPADKATREATASLMPNSPKQQQAKSVPKGSPTTPVSNLPLKQPRQADGTGTVTVSGELKTWHKVTLTLDGPYAHEQDNEPNPFTDYRMTAIFRHADGTTYSIPGYFAADGDAGNTSAESGTKWRVHFAPDREGAWNYTLHFVKGHHAALDANANATAIKPFDGTSGLLGVTASDKTGRDMRAKGRLQYVGKRYLQHAGSKEYFLKAGADAPETLLGYADFDNTIAGKPSKVPLKTWEPHVSDWKDGDPTWKDGKGKGLIGAVNYLAGKGCNAFSFLTYNAGGDGDNVWPFIQREDKMHYDCSKLDQWGVVFDHGTKLGMYLHFKMQETENDDHRRGKGVVRSIPECLDGGDLGPQRKLYCRELIARYGHNLALNWNLGEENTQTHKQQVDMINYIADVDAYDHNIVLHTYPDQQDKIYRPLLGDKSKLTGLSLQNSGIKDTHWQTVKWIKESTDAGKPWIVAFDESGSAAHAQCPDIGYKGFDGRDNTGKMAYTPNEVRKQTLWGQLMGGGAGVEYYFGYQFVENDLVCEDWRSRDESWDYCRIALEFFRNNDLPIQEMQSADELVGQDPKSNAAYCLAKPGEIYVVYVAGSQSVQLDLSGQTGSYQTSVFNPRTGEMKSGQIIPGGAKVDLVQPSADNDWVTVLRKQ